MNELLERVDYSAELKEKQLSFYRDNGYLIVEDIYNSKDIELLRRDSAAICRGSYGSLTGLIPTGPDDSDDDVLKRHLCIHFPHKISPAMASFIAAAPVVDVLTNIIGPNVKCMQSMLFIKAAGKPGQAWHQDEFYIPTRDRSLTGAWLAIDDATTDNGCLWVIPGSHKHGILWPQQEHGDRRFDCAGEAVNFPYTDEDAIAVPLRSGSMVLFNGYLLHRSLPNRAATGYRRALVNHYMSAESLLPWMQTDRSQSIATADYRDIVLVAGKDPYGYKGIEDRAHAHVRPSGEGGCGSQRLNEKKTDED